MGCPVSAAGLLSNAGLKTGRSMSASVAVTRRRHRPTLARLLGLAYRPSGAMWRSRKAVEGLTSGDSICVEVGLSSVREVLLPDSSI
jgi:hypothetical protein